MTEQPDSSGVLLPPPVIYSLFLVVGVAIDYYWPTSLFEPLIQVIAGAGLLLASVVLFALALREFTRAKTSLSVTRSTSKLVTTGPFRVSRNPIYLALNLFYTGIAVLGDLPWTLALVVPAGVTLKYAVVQREEAYLEHKFGEDYRRYKASVRRWI